jgi:uncharacterized protein (TIGR03435 family)
MLRRNLAGWIVAIFAGPIGHAQPAAFEVASIKRSDPTQTAAIRRSGYRIATVNTSLQMLITWAYDVHSDRVYGKPAFLDSVHYDVVANGPENGWPAQRTPGQVTFLQEMMQTLLVERFKLAVHRETKELPMYALVLAKGGPKFKLGPAPESMGQQPFSMPGRGRLSGTQVAAWMLAKVLADQLGRSVQDQTGLEGVFDFKLEWAPDVQPESAEVGNRASLFTAIQEQLGLRLEARKGPVEVLVIDHVESSPNEN